jgi:hypothetical protein
MIFPCTPVGMALNAAIGAAQPHGPVCDHCGRECAGLTIHQYGKVFCSYGCQDEAKAAGR